MNIRFREEHLRSFSAASLDFNPLHLSESYARKTSSGECVVYGVLGFLACLPAVTPPAGTVPFDLRIDFKGPLFREVEYTVEVEDPGSGSVRIVLLDGAAPMMRARLQFRQGVPAEASLPAHGIAPLAAARRLDTADLEAMPSFPGLWGPPEEAYRELMDLLGINRSVWGDALPLAVLCSSYLTGMEMPGETALYSGLRLRIPAQPCVPVTFEIALQSFNSDLMMAQSHFVLNGAGGVWAEGEISALARPSRTHPASVRIDPGPGRFAGKIAMIIGASRGLGAAIALRWVAEGGTAIGVYARSQEDAEELLAASRHLPGRLVMERGDASDPNWCAALKGRVRSEFARLDFLVCNAAPAIPSLRVEEAYFDRIQAYLAKGFALVAAPLTSFLELISDSGGQVLLISSSALQDPPAVWPHYVALKSAVEGLVRTAAAGYPELTFWITRPGRMLTDLSDSPLGRLDAEAPEVVAQRLLDQMHEPAAQRGVYFCA